MSIEFTLQTVHISPQELQEKLPALLTMMNSCLSKKKTPKRRKPRKKKETIGPLIQSIIDDLEKY